MSPSEYTPHGFCLLYDPGLMGLHIASDAVIALSYFMIPIALTVLLYKDYRAGRNSMAGIPDWLIGLFAAFILLCGLTHVMSIYTLYNAAYWTEGYLKAVTACVSIVTGFVLTAPTVFRALARLLHR